MEKILVAMSGGVDSSVTAFLLKERGYDVSGIMLKLFSNEDICVNSRTCCSLADSQDAENVAAKIGVDFHVFNYSKFFKAEVIDRFVASYQSGRTPNPCIDCNRYVKFGALFDRLPMYEKDGIATGHYARIERAGERFLLKKAVDATKDQSYVLYALTQEQLARTLFPLGEMTKAEVREIADRCEFINADKPDSQDICFVTKGSYAEFIEEYTGEAMRSGDFVDAEGNVLGRHSGYMNYTVGQRRGIGIGFNKPMYVCEIRAGDNVVVLGEEKQLYSRRLVARDLNWIAVERLDGAMRASAKIRYNSVEQPAMLHQVGEDEVVVEFDEPQRAVTAGQAVVFYEGDVVIGGGTIV